MKGEQPQWESKTKKAQGEETLDFAQGKRGSDCQSVFRDRSLAVAALI